MLRKALALALAMLVLIPTAALAQSAGDQQYADPFGGQKAKSKSDNGGNSQGTGQLADRGTSGTPAPAHAPSTSSQTAAPAVSSSKQLPRTGLEVVMFFVTGAVLTLTGVVMLRLVARPARRIL